MLYVHLLKVWNRYTKTMFLPHLYQPEEGSFYPLTDGVEISRYYRIINRVQGMVDETETDSWDLRIRQRSSEGYFTVPFWRIENVSAMRRNFWIAIQISSSICVPEQKSCKI